VRVALDAQLCVGTATGIGEYVAGLSRALRRQQLNVVELRESRLDPWRFDRRVLWDQVILPLRARASGADLLHCASGTMPLFVGMPTVVTVHDVAWLHVQAHARPYARYYFGRFSLERYRHAAGIIVDSSFSRDALLEVLAGIDRAAVRVVYPGVAREFCEVARNGGDGRTILAVGTVERRKNLELLIRVLPQLNGARIVCVGPQTPYARECEELAGRLGVAERLELRGYVAREELLALYREAAVVAVPSRYEGFGYAAAQALMRRRAVRRVGSNLACPRSSATTEASLRSTMPARGLRCWRRRYAAIGSHARRAPARAQSRASRGTLAPARVKRLYEAICGTA
jgi:glycosyltransferase involved in cell wall biosynthesis